nr:MAG TPA: hypothetical protein [Caudoviricetes sp.]
MLLSVCPGNHPPQTQCVVFHSAFPVCISGRS